MHFFNKAFVTNKYLQDQFTARCPGCQNDNAVVDQSLMDIQITNNALQNEKKIIRKFCCPLS